MQTFEAIISSLFLLAMFALVNSSLSFEKSVDYSLQTVHLSSDIWHVLELRGDLEKLDDFGRIEVENDLNAIGDETGYCIFIEGVRFTNCRGGEGKDILFANEKTVVVKGVPRKVSYSIAIK